MAVESSKPPAPTKSFTARLQANVPTTYFDLSSQWLSSYGSFVNANAAQVSQIESALRSLTYIIPGRFHDTPLTSESLQTFLSLLTAYNTHLLPSPTPPSPSARYQQFYSVASPIYRRCGALLRTIQYTQLLCEMFAKRAGERVRWRVVVLLEVVKAVLRLCMGRASGNKALIGTGVGDDKQERRIDSGSGEGVIEVPENGEWRMPRTGLRIPQLPSSIGIGGENITDFLGKRVIGADEIKGARRLVRSITSAQGQIAEIMWILRPVVYALALQRCQAYKRDWRPWALGVAMEIASRQLAKRDVKDNVIGGARGLTGVEKEEMARRGWGSAWWAMRGAFYENITREYIKTFATKLKGKPLLDMVGVIVEDYDYLWGEYYFPTATM